MLATNSFKEKKEVPLIVVMGVAGSGKTTIACRLADALGVDFLEGDSLHPQSNVAKMASGSALSDEDRWPWLRAIADRLEEARRKGAGAVVSCSALKYSYRDCLRRHVNGPVRFILLDGPRELISNRISHRKGHFMPQDLLDSQLATLERPGPDEDAVILDISHTVPALVEEAAASLVV